MQIQNKVEKPDLFLVTFLKLEEELAVQDKETYSEDVTSPGV